MNSPEPPRAEEPRAPEPQAQESRAMIGFRTAMILFALLGAAAVATLKGTALFIALLIVLALAVKAYVHHVRSHIE